MARLRKLADWLEQEQPAAAASLREGSERIFEKTGIKRQAELVKLVLTGPAALREPTNGHYPFG